MSRRAASSAHSAFRATRRGRATAGAGLGQAGLQGVEHPEELPGPQPILQLMCRHPAALGDERPDRPGRAGAPGGAGRCGRGGPGRHRMLGAHGQVPLTVPARGWPASMALQAHYVEALDVVDGHGAVHDRGVVDVPVATELDGDLDFTVVAQRGPVRVTHRPAPSVSPSRGEVTVGSFTAAAHLDVHPATAKR